MNCARAASLNAVVSVPPMAFSVFLELLGRTSRIFDFLVELVELLSREVCSRAEEDERRLRAASQRTPNLAEGGFSLFPVELRVGRIVDVSAQNVTSLPHSNCPAS